MSSFRVLFSVLRELGVLFEAPGAGEIEDLPPLAPQPEGQDHAFHAHTPLWAYEHPYYVYPFAEQGLKPVFEMLPPDISLEEVLGKTRLVVFLGAADTPAFRACLERTDTFLLILEPDGRRLSRFASSVPAAKLAGRALILLGELEAFIPPVSQILPPELFKLGYPVFYALGELAGADVVARMVELVEILFYRHRVYQLSGQGNVYSLPMRPLARGLFFDQQHHAYVNVAEYLRWPDIQPLRKAFLGETAVLVAAGPDLAERLDYLRSVRGNAVVIAVNNALKPMLAAGVRPHFVVANDTSLHTGRSWEGVGPLPDVSLVGHCLTDLGGDTFGRKFLFGTFMPELYGHRPELRLHGSVITTAFSLARYMGCARCVLVGAQLCSPDPWKLSYSRGSIHEAESEAERPLTGAWPQLVPVTTLDGRTRYTTLNFLDAAHWLADEIRASAVPCVSVTGETIIAGPGIDFVPNCPVDGTGRLERRLGRVASAQARAVSRGPVLAFMRRDLAVWTSVAQGVEGILGRSGGDFLSVAMQALGQFDQGNVTYLVQRYEGFDNQHFHAAVFRSEDGEEQAAGLRYYLDFVLRMARHFEALLTGQLERLGGNPR